MRMLFEIINMKMDIDDDIRGLFLIPVALMGILGYAIHMAGGF